MQLYSTILEQNVFVVKIVSSSIIDARSLWVIYWHPRLREWMSCPIADFEPPHPEEEAAIAPEASHEC